MKIKFFEEKTIDFPDFDTFKAAHPDSGILQVDGKDCIGTCEGCGMPICVGDRFQQWDEDIVSCESCSDEDQLQTAEASPC